MPGPPFLLVQVLLLRPANVGDSFCWAQHVLAMSPAG